MDRVVTEIVPPPSQPLPSSTLFKSTKPDWKLLKDHFFKEGFISKPDALRIISQAHQLFKAEPNITQLQDPVTVVGDIHGQYYDLMKLLELGGSPDRTKYLFLGDYVDRGMFSIEVILLLYSLKINYPNLIYMIRGNHECRQMTSMFSFRKECVFKYDLEVYESFMDSFDCIPMACILNGSFLSVHGGISPDLVSIKDIENMYRFCEPSRSGLQCDLLWADPIDSQDGRLAEVYKSNETRGCSYFFGGEATRKFLNNNDLVSVIRAHEAQKDGYKMQFWNGPDFPSVITIFSAPNYCDCYKNKGAIIKFDNSTLNIQQYNYSKHPYVLPDFMDVFAWSVPFVMEKIVQMLVSVLRPKGKIQCVFDDSSRARIKELEDDIARYSGLSGSTVEAITRSLQTLRARNEFVIKEGNFREEQPISSNLVEPDKPRLYNDVDNFNDAKTKDKEYEKRPN